MVRSMTGYGRGENTANDCHFVVEIKAVNHRYNDITIKLPRFMNGMEDAIRKRMMKEIARGKTDIYVTFESFSIDNVIVKVNENYLTTYGENIGVMAVTRVYSVYVIAGAAILSIFCSFIGKLSALIGTIPGSVIGGISFLLYGMIGTSGIRILVDSKVDFSKSKNLILTSIIFVTGLSGVTINLGNVQLSGMILACIVGMILSLLFYILDKFHLTNDEE